MVVCVECLPADKPWDVVPVTRRGSGVAPRACVRVYARVLVPPNIYTHAYIPPRHMHMRDRATPECLSAMVWRHPVVRLTQTPTPIVVACAPCAAEIELARMSVCHELLRLRWLARGGPCKVAARSCARGFKGLAASPLQSCHGLLPPPLMPRLAAASTHATACCHFSPRPHSRHSLLPPLTMPGC